MISILLPTRGRPDELSVALKSLDLPKYNKEALVWLDTDDPKLELYKELLKDNPRVRVFIRERVGYVNGHLMLNFLAEKAKHDWFFFFNDDAYMDNPDWSDIFKDFVQKFDPKVETVVINIWGQGNKANLFPIVSRKYVDVCGHFSMGTANDDWVRIVSMRAGIDHQLHGIKPKHRKYGQDDTKGDLRDDTYHEAEAARAKNGHEWHPERGPARHILEDDVRRIIEYNLNRQPQLSVLVPSRGRAEHLKFSFDSLGLEENNLEALVWVDDDDPQLVKYQELFTDNQRVKLFIKPRVGYKGFHTMINFLASHAAGDWLFLWNDDAYMDSPNWYKVFAEYAYLIDPKEEPLVFNIWTPLINHCEFPIVSRRFYELLGHFSQNTRCDIWAFKVSHYARIQRQIHGIDLRHRKYGQDPHLGDLEDDTRKEVDAVYAKSKYLGSLSKGAQSARRDDVEKILASVDKRHAGFIGLGKLGLPVALAMEARGNRLVGYDVNPQIKQHLQERQVPYKEEDLEKLLAGHLLEHTESVKDLVQRTDLIFCAVQTPHDPRFEGHHPLPEERADFDYSYLKNAVTEVVAAAEELGKKINLVVISTCLPGTYETEIKPLLTANINYVYNPFFIAMGTVVKDFYNPEFVLIGKEDGDITPLLNFYKLTIGAHNKFFVTDITTAEGIKVFYNTFITTKTVLGNMYGEFAHKLGMNVDHIHEALSLATDRLMSPKYLKAGVGDGGGCFLAGTPVYAENGIKHIEQIEPGELVLSDKGELKPVLNAWERNYSGEIIKLKVEGMPSLYITSDHRVWAAEDLRKEYTTTSKNKRVTKRFTNKSIQLKLSGLVEKQIGELSPKSWYLPFPIPQGIKVEAEDSIYIELAGFYLSEGSCTGKKNKEPNTVTFALHTNEKILQDRIKELARGLTNNTISQHKKKTSQCTTIKVYDTKLARRLVKDFGHLAWHKKIPGWILYGPLENARLLLRGIFYGDGHNGKTGYYYSTTSEQLAYGVNLLLERLGIASTIQKFEERVGKDGVKHRIAYEVRVRNAYYLEALGDILDLDPNHQMQTKRYPNRIFLKGGYRYRKILRMERMHFEGKVYNLNVADYHKYVVPTGLKSNCHPRDNIALSHLADKYNLSFNFFEQLMAAREKHMEWLGQLFEEEMKASGLPGIILGKSFKPETNIQTGSSAILLTNILKNKGLQFEHYEFDYPNKMPKAVYLIATNHQDYVNLQFPQGSTVIDPFRMIPKKDGVNVISIGQGR